MTRQYPKNRFVSGEYKRSSDISGFDYLRSELVENWDGTLVEPKNVDPKPRDMDKHIRPATRNLRFE